MTNQSASANTPSRACGAWNSGWLALAGNGLISAMIAARESRLYPAYKRGSQAVVVLSNGVGQGFLALAGSINPAPH
jgi:hypothetical protein